MIDVVINYCSIDYKFIKRNIEECIKFGNRIMVVVCDHLLDGTPENMDDVQRIAETFREFPNVHVIQYEWDSTKDAKYHHNMSRWIGLSFCEEEHVLLLDADEIIDGDTMKEYLSTGDYLQYDVQALKCYWYFREPIYRAKQTEMAGCIYRKSVCTQEVIFAKNERWAYTNHPHLKVREQLTHNNKIMCHHFSWVRTKEEMLTKVRNWAHKNDYHTFRMGQIRVGMGWNDVIEEEFTRPFNGTDFIHGYQYDIVDSLL